MLLRLGFAPQTTAATIGVAVWPSRYLISNGHIRLLFAIFLTEQRQGATSITPARFGDVLRTGML